MRKVYPISSETLTFEEIQNILAQDLILELSEEAKSRIVHCRHYLDEKLEASDSPVYGINTGFGSLCNRSISPEDLGKLQENLVKSHACGTGDEIPSIIVRLMILLKIQALSYGNSGVQLSTVQRLVEFFNHGITPVVYEYGSLGASGDLAPLAHMSLPLIGEGEVYYQGKKQASGDVLKLLGWEPVRLMSKEGLALLNGTQFMSAFGTWCMIRANKLMKMADITAAISLDAFDGRIEPFHDAVNRIRNQEGQILTARRFRDLLEGSELIGRRKTHVQDPYSFRCVPQVHGATRDTLNYAGGIITREINAVTDNPTVLPGEDLIVSAGNFHGQPLALVMDYLSIALSELGNISERRTYQLLSGKRGLPSFLIANPGLNSGFMIPQYTSASLVSRNKQLSTPASVDSIESSQGQEDHVSMGANAATKLYRVVNNLEQILAIELFNAAQALEFRRPYKTSPYLEKLVSQYRQIVPFIKNDQVMYRHIHKTVEFIREYEMNLPE
ncbi:MAG TPA: histidine ammonia-lyase [Bacteroidales bacterium]|nr:histidine ammonia-lyase [Bacteroidales bacterium]